MSLCVTRQWESNSIADSRTPSPDDEASLKTNIGAEVRISSPVEEQVEFSSQNTTDEANKNTQREMRAFKHFFFTERNALWLQHPQLSIQEVSKKTVNSWHQMTRSERLRYIESTGEDVTNDLSLTISALSEKYALKPGQRKRPSAVKTECADSGLLSPKIKIVEPSPLRSYTNPSTGFQLGQVANSLRKPWLNPENKRSPLVASVAAAIFGPEKTIDSQDPTSQADNTPPNTKRRPAKRSKDLTNFNGLLPSSSYGKRARAVATMDTTNSSSSTMFSDSMMAGNQAQPQAHVDDQSGWTCKSALEMYYKSLCEPAFPQTNEPPICPQSANEYYDIFRRVSQNLYSDGL